MQMTFRMVLSIPCPACGARDGHNDGCEKVAMEELRMRNIYLSCLKCDDGQVGVNQSDYFECRSCHTQFSSSGIVDCHDPERATLIDVRRDQIIPVLVLQSKGEGNFPIDQALEELQERLAKRLQTSKKGKRKR